MEIKRELAPSNKVIQRPLGRNFAYLMILEFLGEDR